jgi:hypothetical protein
VNTCCFDLATSRLGVAVSFFDEAVLILAESLAAPFLGDDLGGFFGDFSTLFLRDLVGVTALLA